MWQTYFPSTYFLNFFFLKKRKKKEEESHKRKKKRREIQKNTYLNFLSFIYYPLQKRTPRSLLLDLEHISIASNMNEQMGRLTNPLRFITSTILWVSTALVIHAESPQLFLDWTVSYSHRAPLGVEKQVGFHFHKKNIFIYIYTFSSSFFMKLITRMAFYRWLWSTINSRGHFWTRRPMMLWILTFITTWWIHFLWHGCYRYCSETEMILIFFVLIWWKFNYFFNVGMECS